MRLDFQRFGYIVICIFAFAQANSQSKYLFEIPKPKTNLTHLNFYIDQVKDLRYDTSNVGFVYKGIFNKKINCSLKNGTKLALTNFFSQLISETNNQEKIRIHITNLSVSEDSSFPEKALCSFRAKFIDNAGNVVYNVNISESRKGFDVTGFHANLISNMLIKSVELFDLSRQTCDKFIPSIIQKNLENKILISKNLKKGFYSSFEELQADNPSIRPEFTVIKKAINNRSTQINIDLINKDIDKEKLLSLIWGFSDGQNVYIKSTSTKSKFAFNIIKNIGRYAHFIDFTKNENINLPTFEVKDEFVMDMKTGKIWSFNQTTLQRILVQDPKMFKVYTKQPIERKELLKDFWLEQFNLRYVEKLRNRQSGS